MFDVLNYLITKIRTYLFAIFPKYERNLIEHFLIFTKIIKLMVTEKLRPKHFLVAKSSLSLMFKFYRLMIKATCFQSGGNVSA